MSDTHTPADGPGPYPALGLTLAPGRIRNQTLLFIGVPFLLTVVLVVLLSTSGSGGDDPYYGGFPGSTSGGAFPGGDPFGTEGTTNEGDDTPGDTGPAWTEDPAEATDPTDDATYGTEETTGGIVDDPAPTGPSSVVTAYFDAINRGDYSTAWYLGGRNLDPDYDHFAAGFGTTARDEVTIDGTAGETVSVTFVAWHTDGSWQTYGGTYTVRGGEIVSADIQEKD
ncbi:hypothetical protein [Streptomyces tagetis]|uniref:Uncharacterized protein n=1 Tax=Streptomyces tagetis TaxID=2820809 RepID=A0A940XM07_9ACTN|nr:hypothetical protein [Streptomyces sp. RG38]MBQ0828861.1 hypothetical protein [Streptomyces sp. RG38]